MLDRSHSSDGIDPRSTISSVIDEKLYLSDKNVPDSSQKQCTSSSIPPQPKAYYVSENSSVVRHDVFRTESHPATFVQNCSPSLGGSRASSVTEFSNSGTEPMEWLKFRLTSGFFAYFLCGWGDGVTGTVLPYFTAAYHLNTMTSSLLFTGSLCGFFVGTFIVERVMNFLGSCPAERPTTSLIPYVSWKTTKNGAPSSRYSASQARHLSLVFSSVLHAMFFIMVGKRGGYAVTFLAYALAALARSFMTATLNAYYVAGPPQSSFGYAYGLWSVGGMISPIVCQTIIAKGIPWTHFYLGSLVLSGINTVLLYLAFRPTSRENIREWNKADAEKKQVLSSPTSSIDAKGLQQKAPLASRSNTLRLALLMPYQWAFSVFALLYSGNETTTQGFAVTYLLGTRHANPKTVGYVTSGYWGGFAVARFIWGTFVPRLTFTQRKFIILGSLTLAVLMHVLIRVVDSNIENSFSVALIGFFYGPVFPGILRLTNDILPPEVQMISMGLISAFASVGSALFPFISGTISDMKGVSTIPYLTISLNTVLIGIWSLFPTRLPIRTTTAI